MLKKGKKLLLLVLALVVALAMFAGCSRDMTEPWVTYNAEQGGEGAEVTSNGGFVVQKGDWFYFINGVESSSSDNTYGDVEKGSLMRISAADMASGAYEEAEIVVPELMVASDYNAGLFIYGDYVYYATPNTIRNLDGEVESGYLNFRRARLDGSAMTHYYVQVSSSSTEYRFVVENEKVYLVYFDTTDSRNEIHSYNITDGVDTVLAAGYTSAEFDLSDPESPVIYYTMPVVQEDTYTASSQSGTNESYNQLYRVTAATTSGPLSGVAETDAYKDAYTDRNADESDENRTMEYINLGTLVLDGIGKAKRDFVTPFNADYENVNDLKSAGDGFSYTIVRYAGGQVILSIADQFGSSSSSSSTSSTRYFLLEDSGVTAAGDAWNSITANAQFGIDSGELLTLSLSTSNITESTLFYKDGGEQYYMYVADGVIYRSKVVDDAQANFAETDILAREATDAVLLFADPINESDPTQPAYLYYYMTGSNGRNLYRIQYNAAAADYKGGTATDAELSPTQYLNIDYNDTWYAPETVGGYLFFASEETYCENYVYAMVNPATNEELETLNDLYETVNNKFTSMDTNFADAANLARYYYYGGDMDIVNDTEGDHYGEYQAEDWEVFNAFCDGAARDAEGYNTHNFNFSDMKGENGTLYNTRDAFYKRLGKITDDDAETIQDSLESLLLTATTDSTDDAWTWQWAAIFVPVGVVLIAGVAVAFVLVRRKKRK